MGWTIKQMSEMSGIPLDTLRYYDKFGIVSPKRMSNNYRYYDEEDFIYLQYITVMKYTSFSLSEIKMIINRMILTSDESCNSEHRCILTSKKFELIDKVNNINNIVKLIDELLPMIDNHEAYTKNERQIDAFVNNIYKEIKK